jgi:hypothetical protein
MLRQLCALAKYFALIHTHTSLNHTVSAIKTVVFTGQLVLHQYSAARTQRHIPQSPSPAPHENQRQ